MKKVSLLYFFVVPVLFFFCDACKPKGKHAEHDDMKHYYKVYSGNIAPNTDVSRIDNDVFKYCTFKDSIRKYFKNTDNNLLLKPGSTVKIYQYVRDSASDMDFDKNVLGSDPVIVLINETLSNNVENPLDKSTKHAMGRGNMGCIPKFEQNASGNLFYYDQDGSRYLPLMTADHSKADQDSIIYYLTNYNFKISMDNYKKLNKLFKDIRLIEAGLDSLNNVVTLSIYKSANDTNPLKIKGI